MGSRHCKLACHDFSLIHSFCCYPLAGMSTCAVAVLRHFILQSMGIDKASNHTVRDCVLWNRTRSSTSHIQHYAGSTKEIDAGEEMVEIHKYKYHDQQLCLPSHLDAFDKCGSFMVHAKCHRIWCAIINSYYQKMDDNQIKDLQIHAQVYRYYLLTSDLHPNMFNIPVRMH